MEGEEESSCPCVECEVPRELLLHRDQLILPLDIRFERFEENILIVQQFWYRSRKITVCLGDWISKPNKYVF